MKNTKEKGESWHRPGVMREISGSVSMELTTLPPWLRKNEAVYLVKGLNTSSKYNILLVIEFI